MTRLVGDSRSVREVRTRELRMLFASR
ncbi:hypothetical protein [Microbacterium sp. BF1]|nr:hypothetical protein [Microbacterium sp. BF1]